MRPFVEHLRAVVGRLGAGRLMLCLVLFLAPWHFKILSSLPRLLDVTRWWAPSLFPETLVTVAAAIVSLVVLRRSPPLGRIPGAPLLIASVVLCVAALAVSSVSNERHTVHLVRVVVLQYALAAVVFWMVWRHTETITHLATLAGALVAGGGLLYLVATPVYFISFSHFPPPGPIPWPSRMLYNRNVLLHVHDDPRMLYDNVTFGNVLNVSQVLVVLLPLALGLAFVVRSRGTRVMAIGAAMLFALHLDFCYSRGPLLATVATLAILGWLVHREFPKVRVVTAVALTGWAVLTFGATDLLRYWSMQFSFHEASSARERLYFVLQPLGFRDLSRPRVTARVNEGTTETAALAAAKTGAAGRSAIGPPLPPLRPPDQAVGAVTLDGRYQVVTVPGSSYVRMAVAGLGYGNYGMLIGRVPGAGTHNVFLNALVNTGVMGLLGLIGLTVWAVRNFGRYLKGTARADRSTILGLFLAVAFGNVLVVGVLSLYEFEYLGTGTGATLFAFLLGASARLATIAEGQSLDGAGHAR